MWQHKHFYYAVPKGLSKKEESNWIVVQYFDREGGIFKKTGSTHAYKLKSFEHVSYTPVSTFVRHSRALKMYLDSGKKEITVNIKSDDPDVTNLLNVLKSLQCDFAGTISLTDVDRQNKTQQVYSLTEKISKKL